MFFPDVARTQKSEARAGNNAESCSPSSPTLTYIALSFLEDLWTRMLYCGKRDIAVYEAQWQRKNDLRSHATIFECACVNHFTRYCAWTQMMSLPDAVNSSSSSASKHFHNLYEIVSAVTISIPPIPRPQASEAIPLSEESQMKLRETK